jgi:hypothetical protein
MMNHTIFVDSSLEEEKKKVESVPKDKQFVEHVSMVKLAGGVPPSQHLRLMTQSSPV